MKSNKGLKIITIIVLIAYVIGVAAIGIYKFDNRDISVQVYTDKGVYTHDFSKEEIKQDVTCELDFGNIESIGINSIKLFGDIKSVYLKKMVYSEMFNYIDGVNSSSAMTDGKWLIFADEENVHVVFNENFSKMLRTESASFMLERFILLGILSIFVMLILMAVTVYKEKLTENQFYNHGPIFEAKKFAKDLKKYWQYTVYAAKTDLKAEVANSYLNRLWWLLEPFFNMLVYVIVFGKMLGSSIENYATFVFSGLLMWSFFNKALMYSVKLVRNNRDIVTKVYIPKFVILISQMILNMYKLLFSLVVLVPMLFVFKVHIGLGVLWIIPAYLLMILFSFGAGMILLHLGVYVDDLGYAVGILISMLMFLSGIFYEVMTTLPEPLNIMMLCLNPAALFVDTMRNALIYNTVTNVPLIVIWLILSSLLCAVGVHVVYKNENSYVKVV